MNDSAMLALASGTGFVLGAVFFGGLWWTVRKGVSSGRPALWFFASLILRTSIVLAGFGLVSGGQWERLVACLLGFVVARFIVSRIAAASFERGGSPAKKAGHAT